MRFESHSDGDDDERENGIMRVVKLHWSTFHKATGLDAPVVIMLLKTNEFISAIFVYRTTGGGGGMGGKVEDADSGLDSLQEEVFCPRLFSSYKLFS